MRIEKRAFAWIVLAIAAAIGLSLALLVHTRYFAASELGAKPFPLRRIDLDLPKVQDGVEYYGKVRLDVFINREGAVDRVEIADSKVPARLRDMAVNAFSQSRWEPGRKWGMRVKSLKKVEIDFEPPPGALDRLP